MLMRAIYRYNGYIYTHTKKGMKYVSLLYFQKGAIYKPFYKFICSLFEELTKLLCLGVEGRQALRKNIPYHTVRNIMQEKINHCRKGGWGRE